MLSSWFEWLDFVSAFIFWLCWYKNLIWSEWLDLNFCSGYHKSFCWSLFMVLKLENTRLVPHETPCHIKFVKCDWDLTMLKLRKTLIWIEISAQFGPNQLSEGSEIHVTTTPSALLHVCQLKCNWKEGGCAEEKQDQMDPWEPTVEFQTDGFWMEMI